jgi:hypothetical protein
VNRTAAVQLLRLLNQDFREFAEFLNARGVECFVVGGHALGPFTGTPTMPTTSTSGRGPTNKRASGRLKDLTWKASHDLMTILSTRRDAPANSRASIRGDDFRQSVSGCNVNRITQ